MINLNFESATLAAGISFVDDIHSLPDSVRLGSAVYRDVPDVRVLGDPALGELVAHRSGPDSLRGHYECLQFHGWYQRDERRLYAGCAAAGLAECEARVR